MYIPPRHSLTDTQALWSLMQAHPLGAWVCQGAGGLLANHLPFLLDRARGPHGTLCGHVSRANPVWRALGEGAPSVVMFQGPQAYISPGWYPGKAAHGRVVPTWNYVVAHGHGVARAVHERAWLTDLLERLTAAQESGRPAPWQVVDAPARYIEQMLGAIVGIEIPIDRLEGKCKASQDEAMPDRLGTVRGLREQPESATYQGDTRYDDRWTDLAPEAIAARLNKALNDALAQIDLPGHVGGRAVGQRNPFIKRCAFLTILGLVERCKKTGARLFGVKPQRRVDMAFCFRRHGITGNRHQRFCISRLYIGACRQQLDGLGIGKSGFGWLARTLE